MIECGVGQRHGIGVDPIIDTGPQLGQKDEISSAKCRHLLVLSPGRRSTYGEMVERDKGSQSCQRLVPWRGTGQWPRGGARLTGGWKQRSQYMGQNNQSGNPGGGKKQLTAETLHHGGALGVGKKRLDEEGC